MFCGGYKEGKIDSCQVRKLFSSTWRVEEIKKAINTRFMIITHHRLTMARMDRLYGVTMTEKGVSQLVSVNLEKAVDLREIT